VSHYPLEYFSTSECVANSPSQHSSDLLNCQQLSNRDSYVDWTAFDFELASSTLPPQEPESSQPLVEEPSFDAIFNPIGDNLIADNLWNPMQQNDNSLFSVATLQSFDHPITTLELQPRFRPISTALNPISDQSSPDTSSSTTSLKHSRPSSEPEQEPDKAQKRRRNNAAAAKYRQKKFDRITELEGQLADMAKDREGLRLQLAKRDAEVEILRQMLAIKK